jgi:energy-coupling factor transporter ATP-binding protein EcfA2
MDEVNNAIAKGVAQVITDVGQYVWSGLQSAGRSEFKKLSVDFESGFRTFLNRNFKKYSKIKTLLNPGSPLSLEAVYESPSLEIGDETIDEDAFLDLIAEGNFAVITGRGGSGKSVFLKHIFVRYYNEARGRVPFFVELRNVPGSISLRGHMEGLLKAVSATFDSEMFEYALKSGKFIFLLDGFDEVDHDRRAGMAKEILDLAYAYGDNLFIASSRPDEIFNGWDEFLVAEMKGFTKQQVISLIKKVKFDRQAKTGFLKLIKETGLFDSHASYLSNPLLCTIMLLTYEHGAEIPKKMHLFLGQTFDVLFYRHDATKGGAFRRKFHTSLLIDDFRSTLSAFSTFSYSDYGPSMKQSEALLAAEKSLEYCGFDEKADDFLLDLCSSLSLIVREGDIYSYIHRTFQEYFFAVFLATNDIEDWGDAVEQVVRDRPNDSVVQLLQDINRDRFEQEFLAPRIKSARIELENIEVERNPAAAFHLFFLDMTINIKGLSNRVAGWIIGRDSVHPSHYFLNRFLIANEVSPLPDFDWLRHASEHGMAINVPNVNFGKVTDDMLLGTPIVAYLQRIKSEIITLDAELTKRATSQQRLLSHMLFRKKRRGSA